MPDTPAPPTKSTGVKCPHSRAPRSLLHARIQTKASGPVPPSARSASGAADPAPTRHRGASAWAQPEQQRRSLSSGPHHTRGDSVPDRMTGRLETRVTYVSAVSRQSHVKRTPAPPSERLKAATTRAAPAPQAPRGPAQASSPARTPRPPGGARG